MVVRRTQNPTYKRYWYWYALAALLVLVAAMVVLELTNTTHFFHAEKPKAIATTGSPDTKGSGMMTTPPPPAQSGGSTGGSGSSKQPTPSPAPSSATLTAPWGTFANVYSARLDDQMQSTCNTTPGATCQLIFTNGSLTKSLDAENTDSGGAVYWAWKPSEVGLTPGTWHLTFKAVLGSQTKTTSNDPLTLTVSQ